MLICMTKDGKLIEMQSHAKPGTLIRNAVAAGYNKGGIVEREVSASEWASLARGIGQRTPEQEKEDLIQAKIRELAVSVLIKEGKLTADGKIAKEKQT